MARTNPPRLVTLSALEFDVLIEHLRLETTPLVLKVPSPGRTHTERAELVERAWRSLASRDLGRPTGLDPELEAMLRLLARPTREVDGRMWLGRSVRVLAAADDDAGSAVLVIKDGDALTMRSAAITGLPREALSALPPQPPGPGRSVSVRSSDLDAAAAEAGDNVEQLSGVLQRRGVRPDDAETLTGMVAGAAARGQFGAAARSRSGRRVRAGRVVGFFDTPHGRYAQLRRESPSGELWSTVAPVDARRLTAHVEELLAEVTDQSWQRPSPTWEAAELSTPTGIGNTPSHATFPHRARVSPNPGSPISY
ncbi:ESX secretion-associated protein EspG [Saccharopolyspora subtropica]|uniref:ESX secretion-associated protein EspG n=1 Tax=Saccharopolyspora thermophila TaxID=89367 RepID=A0A917JMX2_9PSEU|nr:ESX secretion-associated protein EspG [Saccharopolyspora subtropica]GGI77446.1 ESX secretion-associated protein EspG [Saccharopolyspora subtropica]